MAKELIGAHTDCVTGYVVLPGIPYVTNQTGFWALWSIYQKKRFKAKAG